MDKKWQVYYYVTPFLYVTRKEKQILLLHAFVKKTDKTPLKEIDIALSRIPSLDK